MGVPYTSGAGAAGASISVPVRNRRGYRIRIEDLSGSFSAAPVAAVKVSLTGSTSGERWSVEQGGAGSFSHSFDSGLLFEAGEDVTGAIVAPGGAVVARLNLNVRQEPINPRDA